jgi:nicotinate-nucleotide pyrophosphorylase (carboxylating)
MTLPDAISRDRFNTLLRLAREEDLGRAGDITSRLLAEPIQTAMGKWVLRAREAGRFCGGSILPAILEEIAPEVHVDPAGPTEDSRDVEPGDMVAALNGRVVQMLAAERTILNLLSRLSGVATLTRAFVSATAGTPARIFDTRKTLPGWRDLDRYAVRCGGGHNHRGGLHDAVLIKDNHLAGIPTGRLAHYVFEMLGRIEAESLRPRFVEVEVDGLEQFDELLKVMGVDVILLDNFPADDAREAVARRDRAGLRGKIELELSGGVTLANVGDYAKTGVERIAVGAITHSAVGLDLGLDVVA